MPIFFFLTVRSKKDPTRDFNKVSTEIELIIKNTSVMHSSLSKYIYKAQRTKMPIKTKQFLVFTRGTQTCFFPSFFVFSDRLFDTF